MWLLCGGASRLGFYGHWVGAQGIWTKALPTLLLLLSSLHLPPLCFFPKHTTHTQTKYRNSHAYGQQSAWGFPCDNRSCGTRAQATTNTCRGLKLILPHGRCKVLSSEKREDHYFGEQFKPSDQFKKAQMGLDQMDNGG